MVYIDIFNDITSFPVNPFQFQQEYMMDWGFGLLSWLVKFFFLGYTGLFFCISGLTFVAMAVAARRFGTDLLSVLPYYLGTFYLSQQFMEIRQGLAVALAFWCISYFTLRERAGGLRILGTAASGFVIHAVSALPVFVGKVLMRTLPKKRSRTNALWAVGIFLTFYVSAQAATHLDALTLFDRISVYNGDPEYAATRGLFEPANVRAFALTLLFYFLRPSEQHHQFKPYMLLLGLYMAHFGLRLGFIDFAILSGRLSTSLGFAEVFLFPMMVATRVKGGFTRSLIAIVYLAFHLAIALSVQLPYLIDDYFTPIYGYSAQG